MKIDLATISNLLIAKPRTAVTNQPACPQRGEDIHSKQAGLEQTGGFVTRGEIIVFPAARFCNSILCRPANGTLSFAPISQTKLSGKKQSGVSATAPSNSDVAYLFCQVYPDTLTMNNNIFTK